MAARTYLDRLWDYNWITQKIERQSGSEGVNIRLAPSNLPRNADDMEIELPWRSVREIAQAIHSLGQEILRSGRIDAPENAALREQFPLLVQRIILVDPTQKGLLGNWELSFPPRLAPFS